MGKKTESYYVCDCCGIRSGTIDFQTKHENGSAILKITGSHGGMAFNGDWGGTNYKVEDLLCFGCSAKLRKLYSTLKKDMEGVR